MQLNKQASFEQIICLSCLKQGKLQEKFKIYKWQLLRMRYSIQT